MPVAEDDHALEVVALDRDTRPALTFNRLSTLLPVGTRLELDLSQFPLVPSVDRGDRPSSRCDYSLAVTLVYGVLFV
jgi:hypothetical protein